MRIENELTVPVPRGRAWAGLMDMPLVVSCMPGAELVETLGEERWKVSLAVKLGPVALTFGSELQRELADAEAGRLVMAAKARELKGRGGATAKVEAQLADAEGGTRVAIVTDVTLSGTAAQFGRPVVQDVSRQLTARFAACLQEKLAAAPGAAAAPVEAPAAVGGLGLLARAWWERLARLLRLR